jgi:sulfur relay protein TusB/DsrH
MPSLFILYRSDPTRKELTFKLAKSGDAIALIHDGITAEGTEIRDLMRRGVKVFALQENVAANLDTRNGAERIKYDQLVDLIVKHDRVFS